MYCEVKTVEIGISSSCFYPEETEKAFEKVVSLGAASAEIFFNCESELGGETMKKLERIKNESGVTVRSIHPYTSFAEPYIIFGGYKRRVYEGVEFYKKYFEAAARLGAECVVLHGGNAGRHDEREYFESFRLLCDAAKPYGVIPAHEIVYKRSASDIDFLKKLKAQFGDEFKVVLDNKQCRRCGIDEQQFIRNFAGDIIQVHISDYDRSKDCIPPGEGYGDFKKLFDLLKSAGYDKTAIIELYKWGYETEKQIENSRIFLENLLKK